MSYEVLLLLERADPAAEALGEIVPPPTKKELADALGHTRDWPDAAAAVARARAAVKLVDELPSEERLGAFVARAAAACARLPCVAVWWVPGRAPASSRARSPRPRATAIRCASPLNVRLFHVEEGRADERVMDTVGLAALELPDVQCHFFALDVAAVAALLEETARYLWSEGDVIGDGDTVAGTAARRRALVCRREVALVDPPRDVIDMAPPAAHAAGRT